ncbi:hypothetical protein EON79_13100 [bacterium]|nr:MAG: hypothetical protein EON79_13100 [bacterium]
MSQLWPKTSLIAVTMMMVFASVAEAQQSRSKTSSSQGKNGARSRGRVDRRAGSTRWTTNGSRTSNRWQNGRPGNPFGTGRPLFPSYSQGRPGGISPFGYNRYRPITPQPFGRPLYHDTLWRRVDGGRGFGGSGVSVGVQIGGLRVGFFNRSGLHQQYRPASRRFSYPFYCYNPYTPQTVVVASPWYGYSFLPPYLDGSRVTYGQSLPAWGFDDWDRYDGETQREDTGVRDALNDLQEAFKTSRGRIADRLVPEQGEVAIFNEGRYDYSLSADDFQKMLSDAVEDARTTQYSIQEARQRGDEVRVRARHTFTDSWGKEESVTHLITLRRENGGDFVIREFGTE